MNKAIRIYETGGPEVLKLETINIGPPKPKEVGILQTAIGLNYIDIYGRTGLYPLPSLPHGLGMEATGIIETIGKDIKSFNIGDRVAYISTPPGAYAERRNVPADRLIPLPTTISDEMGAAMMLKGLTAQYLLRQTYKVKRGDSILIHAAAGGVGLIICQWAKHLGATVIGTVGNEKKAELAKKNGCDHTIIYTKENFKKKVIEITNGKGVEVVYDSIGQKTFMDSLDCLKPLGTMVSFGNATGPVNEFSIGLLATKGSLFLTRPTLFTYIDQIKNLRYMSNELFKLVNSGIIKININQKYSLVDTAQAHIDIEKRDTTGSTILIP